MDSTQQAGVACQEFQPRHVVLSFGRLLDAAYILTRLVGGLEYSIQQIVECGLTSPRNAITPEPEIVAPSSLLCPLGAEPCGKVFGPYRQRAALMSQRACDKVNSI